MAKLQSASTMEQLVTAPLNEMLSSLLSLQTLLSSSNSTATYSSLPGLIDSLTTADDNLATNLEVLHQHQANYARILSLRARALELEDQIKTIVRRADTLHNQIGQIHPSILEDSDEEEETNDVDYETLLAFAARIGKHNYAAALEAENEADRIAAESRHSMNGDAAQQEEDDIARQKADMDLAIARQRAVNGMAFPDNNILRLGALGRLQMLREGERGEDAVDEEVARLIRETEPVAEDEVDEDAIKRQRREAEEKARKDQEWREREAARKKANAAKASQSGAGKLLQKEEKKKTLSLDFDDDSDEED